MTHEDCLNILLANACGMNEPAPDGTNDFYIELHCTAFIVTARLKTGHPTITYDVLSIRPVH